MGEKGGRWRHFPPPLLQGEEEERSRVLPTSYGLLARGYRPRAPLVAQVRPDPGRGEVGGELLWLLWNARGISHS
jgi:hypothetical protein